MGKGGDVVEAGGAGEVDAVEIGCKLVVRVAGALVCHYVAGMGLFDLKIVMFQFR